MEVSSARASFRRMRRLIGIPIALFIGALAAGCGSHKGSSPTGSSGPMGTTSAKSSPVTTAPDASNFDGHVVDNPWFPLVPGMTWAYRGVKDGEPAREIMIATSKTKMIQGVSSTVVSDKLYLSGKLEEQTLDYYAQDKDGNVWYFGEDTAELKPNGDVKNTEGSWQAGRDGAVAGIFMPADPHVGQAFRQEYYKGQAEDHFRILSLNEHVKTLGASSDQAMLTMEWTPLEPDVIDHKYYVRGIGTVLEKTAKGPTERNTLTSFHK
jgi:hypothetical protein